ncbi:MAG: hypothetical protein FJ128_03805 [Deltaproteobacteria bacterium]|nr:hypothetical protein [Deltaproteobacteria bacterium]
MTDRPPHTITAIRNREKWLAMWRTRAFRDFCEANREEVQAELEARLQEYAEKPEREIYEQAWLDMPPEHALEQAFRTAFVGSYEGEQVMGALGLGELQKGPVSYGSELFAGKYLDLTVDLTFPIKRLMAEFEEAIKTMRLKVERPETPPRGGGILNKDEMDRMFEAYDLIENEGLNFTKATWRLFPETEGKQPTYDFDTQACLKQVKRWHERVKALIGDL